MGVGDHAVGALEHVLDQVDAAARAVELVTEQHVGRAGRGAEAAMHAFAQDGLRRLDVGIGELRQGEVRLHRYSASYMRPRLSRRSGSKLSLTRAVSAASAG